MVGVVAMVLPVPAVAEAPAVTTSDAAGDKLTPVPSNTAGELLLDPSAV